jgi:muramoyltetrapeptide carboxypeptidase
MKASALRSGDLVTLIAPASAPIAEERVTKAVSYFESMGYRVALGKHLFERRGYLAGTDRQRLDDLHAAFRDPKIRAIFFIRGGYGSLRLLPEIDYDLIRKNPKILVGYSDATALFHALHKHAGLTSLFYGPMPGVDIWNGFDPFAEVCFWKALTSTKPLGELPMDEEEGVVLGKKKFATVTARMMGGNLTVFSSLCGTPYMLPAVGKALLFEDIDEKPYRVDRYFAQLRSMGMLESAAAMLLGQFTGCEADPNAASLTMEEIVKDYFGKLKNPVITNLPFGHVRRQWTIPFGAKLEIAASRGGAKISVVEAVLQ